MPDIVFEGGPRHGDRRSVTRLPAAIQDAYVRPAAVLTPGPRPPWWRHPWRWLRWTLPPAPEPQLEFEQVTYRDSGRVRDGARVYEVDGGWPWFKGPEADMTGLSFYHAMVAACGAVPPVVLQDPHTRWVMDLPWWKRLREGYGIKPDPDGNDQAKWKPNPDDRLMGIRIDVTAGGGRPHLENRRYPADYGRS